jgi:hypothetical protein
MAVLALLTLLFFMWREEADWLPSAPDLPVPEDAPDEIDLVELPEVMPSLYIDQIIFPANSQNRRELYADLLSICKEDGIPTKPLTQEELDRLGTIRLQRWIDAERTAYRLESWDYQMAEPQQPPHCAFHLISRGEHVLIERQGLRGMRLDDNTAYQQTDLSNADAGLLLRTPARETVKENDVLQRVAGQPCVETAVAGAEEAVVCTWSGGVEWGFEPRSAGVNSVIDTHYYELFRSIILQQAPAEHSLDKVTTVTFKMGDGLDETIMQPAPATALPAKKP